MFFGIVSTVKKGFGRPQDGTKGKPGRNGYGSEPSPGLDGQKGAILPEGGDHQDGEGDHAHESVGKGDEAKGGKDGIANLFGHKEVGQSDGKLVEGITSRGDGVDVPAEGGRTFHHHHGHGPAHQEVEGKEERRLGEPDLLLGEAEGWGRCLESLKERGIGNPLMFVTDGLQGMPEAIRRAFPGSSHQRCMARVGRKMSSGARRKGTQAILDDFKSACSAESELEAKARLGLFVAKWSQTYPSFRKYLAEPGPFSSCRFPKAVWRPLYTSNAVEAFHACLKRKLRARLALHSLKNGCYLIAVEAERYNRIGRNRKLTGLDELTAGEPETLGMER